MTSKLQVTIPKAIAGQYRIKPGDEVLWVASGEAVRLVPARDAISETTTSRRLGMFDQATDRQAKRQRGRDHQKSKEKNKHGGWTREELYDRGRAR